MLLEAFRLLGKPYHLLLIGGGDGGRSDNVTRLPYCRDNQALAGYIRAADAFVHAGAHETFGLVLLEAMACGRPVVAMRAGAVPELLDERAGVLAEPHADPATAAANFAAAIAALYERDLDSLGSAARRHVVANYSWTRALQGLMSRYQAAVAAHQLPSMARTLSRAESPTPCPLRGLTTMLPSGPAGPFLQVILRPFHVLDARADAHLVDVVAEILPAATRLRRSGVRTAR